MRETGYVSHVRADRGFGFITPDDRDLSDLFFHASALINLPFDETLQERRVEFDVVENRRDPSKLRAIDVRAAR